MSTIKTMMPSLDTSLLISPCPAGEAARASFEESFLSVGGYGSSGPGSDIQGSLASLAVLRTLVDAVVERPDAYATLSSFLFSGFRRMMEMVSKWPQTPDQSKGLQVRRRGCASAARKSFAKGSMASEYMLAWSDQACCSTSITGGASP